jgi:dUTP pyrophosphatase
MINTNIVSKYGSSKIPKYQTKFSSGFDLMVAGFDYEDLPMDRFHEIKPGETKLIPTGLYFSIPEGYELQIRPRSGMSLKTKLRIANSPGTLDSDYRGELGIICDNIAKKSNILVRLFRRLIKKTPYDPNTIILKDGERIAQGIISPVVQSSFNSVWELDKTERGAGGFGSTGK